MKYLEYPLYAEGFVNRFLVSPVYTKAQQFTKSTLNGRINEWLKKGFAIHENPCRKEFIARRQQELPEYRDLKGKQNGDLLTVFDREGKLRLYFPFGNTGVDASGFYYQPTYLRMYAAAILYCEAGGTVDFELETCGGLTLWVNGQLITDFAPFTRNMVKKTKVTIPMNAGDNQVLVCLDDLAERDTDYYFRMKRLGQIPMTIRLCADENVDQEKLDKIEKIMDQLYFEKESWTDEKVYLDISNPFSVPLPVSVTFRSADFTEKMCRQEKLLLVRHYELQPSQEKIRLLHTDEVAPGYCDFLCRIEYQGISISRKIGTQLVKGEFLAHHENSLTERKQVALETVAEWSSDNAFKAAALMKLGRDTQKAEAIILEELEGVRQRRDCSDFHFIFMLYVYGTFGDRISEKLKSALEEAMTGYRYWIDEPGDDVMWFFSENHALLFHCLQYMAGSFLPDRIFTNSGKTGRQVKERGEELLNEWFDGFFSEFVTEWNSNAYIPVDVSGLGCLYNMTPPESELHQKAKRALDMIFRSLCLNAHKGAVMTSFGRTYEKELKGNYNAGTTSLLYLAYNAGYLNRACNGYLPVALGDYEPPAEYGRYAVLAPGRELIFQNTQGFEKHVNLYLYKNSRVLLSTAVGFKPFEKGYQEHILQAEIDEDAQMFITHPGEAFPYGSGRPSFWAGNGYLPMAAQYRNIGILRYHIPEEERLDYTHAYVPLSEFHTYRGEDRILVLEKDGAYIGMKTMNPLKMQNSGPNRYKEFISCGRDNVWVVQVGSMEGFSELDPIIEMFRRMTIRIDGEHTYVNDGNGTEYCMGPDELLTLNGRSLYGYPLDVEGIITLNGGNE